jgi:hypothetical protein
VGDFKHVIQVPVVVNSNTAQVLVVTEIPLTPPAFRIDQIQKLIEIDDCAAVCDKVIINGRLIKNITFKTLKERDCHGDLNRVCGDVRHCTVEIPFHLFVEVEGARDGDMCEVEDAIVAGEFDKLIDRKDDGTFGKLLEKAVIKVRAKVIRIRRLKVDAKDVTPPKLECPTETDVITEPGLDIPEENDHY